MDDLRDLAQPDNADVDLLHWPSPHHLVSFRAGAFVPSAGVKHTPYRLASHLRPTVCAGAGRIVNIPESSMWLCDGIEKTDHSAHRVVRDRRRLLRQRPDTRLLDLAHPDADGATRPQSGAGGGGADGSCRRRARRLSLTGRLVDTRSSAFTVVLFGLIMIVSLPFVGLAPHLLGLMVALFALGFGNGGMDVSMNAQGIQVERRCRPQHHQFAARLLQPRRLCRCGDRRGRGPARGAAAGSFPGSERVWANRLVVDPPLADPGHQGSANARRGERLCLAAALPLAPGSPCPLHVG